MGDNERMTRPSDSGPSVSASSAVRASRRIGLVGCVKKKAGSRQAAKDLYVSTLFSGRRGLVERTCDEWWILSAKYGLLHPDEKIDPYDVTLKRMGVQARRDWSTRVLGEIGKRVRPVAGDTFEIHAGADYRDFGLVVDRRILDCAVENPTEGIPFGEQLRFYNQQALKRRQ
jgi:hypothetical protein